MWINFILIFQLFYFEEYKIHYEQFIKIKENCNQMEKKLEIYGKEIDYYTEKKEMEKVKKILKESHNLSLEYNECRKKQKIMEKKLEKLKTRAREELENEIEKNLSLKISIKEKYQNILALVEKLKFLGEEDICPLLSFKGIEIDKNEPDEIILEKLKILNSILYDIKNEKEKTEKIIKELEKERVLRENLWNFIKKMESEGGGLLDTRLSEGDISKEIEKIEENLEKCQNALKIYDSFIVYWSGVINEFGYEQKEDGK